MNKVICHPLKIISAFIILSLIFCACAAKSDEPASADSGIVINNREGELLAQFFAMDTFMTVSVRDGSINEDTLRSCVGSVYELESLFSVTNENSEVYKLNHSGGETVSVSRETADLIVKSMLFCEETGGAFDITAYPLVRAWGFTTGEYRIPDSDEIAALLDNVGSDRINVDFDADTVTLPDGMMIDLGGIAKGYAGSILKMKLKNEGVKSAVLSLGGNIVCIGAKPDGSDWRVAVRDPEDQSEYFGYVDVSDVSVITSGGYERYFEGDDGHRYWHIIDPATGRPAENGILSSTVITDDDTRGDALSTALFVMGEKKAAEYYKKHGDFDFILVTDDGRILLTEGISVRFTPYDPARTIEIINK